jgi:molybdenum cofactor cytidylyltransferase
MGASNKLLERLDGKPLVCHTVDELLQTGVRPIVVVTGHQSENVRAALSGRQVVFVDNPQFADGLSSSLRVGLAQLDSSIDGALICLGDMPKVRREHIESLLGAFEPSDGREITVPTFAGRRGNPVLWAARYFPMMKELSGDLGARELQKRFVDRVCLVPMPDDAVTIDVDTKEALDSLRSVGA